MIAALALTAVVAVLAADQRYKIFARLDRRWRR